MKLYCDQPHQYWWEYLYNQYQPYSPHNSKHFFDIFSVTHIFWPLLSLLVSRVLVGKNNKELISLSLIIVTILFEIHENTPIQIKKYHRIEKDSSGESSYRGDTLINIIGDISVGVLALIIGNQMTLSRISIVLLISFILITKTVGFEYWTEFITFLGNSPLTL